jgi:BRCA1-associated protein
MPAYFFHLTFELYPSRSPSKTAYTPPPQTNIFTSELPEHRKASWGSFAPTLQPRDSAPRPVASSSDIAQLPASRERPPPARRFSQRTRLSFSDHHDSPVPAVKPPKRPGHRRTQSFAHRDWRFDAISILSIDMNASNGDELTRTRSKSLKHPAQAQSAGGLATKGKFIPSDLKDTEVGWGVVHLYRDGQETPGLYDEVEGATPDFNEEDCTTLCILAVPSYMTPSDFLGFVGEWTREDVSHFRLIKTSRANKYMVLMKFWDAKQARAWRKEWNGKAFNSMEVRLRAAWEHTQLLIVTARVLPCCLRQVDQLPEWRLEPRSYLVPRPDQRPVCASCHQAAGCSPSVNKRLFTRRSALIGFVAHSETPRTAHARARRTPYLPRLS